MPEKIKAAKVLTYQSGKGLSVAIQILLVLSCLTSLLVMFFAFGGMVSTLPDAQASMKGVSADDIKNSVDMVAALEAFWFIVCGVCFIIWLLRFRYNLDYFGIRNLKSKPWHCSWGFIIPIVAVYKPFKACQEIWRASGLKDATDSVTSQKGSILINWWWGFWLLSSALARVNSSIKTTGADGHVDMSAMTAYFFSTEINEIVSIVTAILAIFVVHKLTARQEQMRQDLTPLAADAE